MADLAVEQGRKIVVFSQWRRMLSLAAWAVSDRLASASLRAVFFTGAESSRKRTQSIVDFHDDPSARVMFLTDAGGVGLNLQRAASACIHLELPWNPAVLEQRTGRIYRLGQKRPIDVFHLVTEYGIESRIADLVATKRAVFNGLFDGTTDAVRFDGKASFLADVEKLVAPLPELAARAATAEAADDADDAVDDAPARDDASTDGAAVALLPPAGTDAEGGAARRDPSHPALDANGVRAFLSQIQVRRTDAGAVRIEAPPEVAASLVALLEGMARLVASGAGPGGG